MTGKGITYSSDGNVLLLAVLQQLRLLQVRVKFHLGAGTILH